MYQMSGIQPENVFDFQTRKIQSPLSGSKNKLPIEKLNSRFTLTQLKSVNAPWCNLWRNEMPYFIR